MPPNEREGAVRNAKRYISGALAYVLDLGAGQRTDEPRL